jgi:hypothetical protein
MRDVIDLFQSALFQRLSDPNAGIPTKLFGENTIKVHKETAKKRMEQTWEKLKQLEEARAKQMTDLDEMYENDGECDV